MARPSCRSPARGEVKKVCPKPVAVMRGFGVRLVRCCSRSYFVLTSNASMSSKVLKRGFVVFMQSNRRFSSSPIEHPQLPRAMAVVKGPALLDLSRRSLREVTKLNELSENRKPSLDQVLPICDLHYSPELPCGRVGTINACGLRTLI